METDAGMKPSVMVYVRLVLTAVCWGGTFVAGRDVARHLGPFSAAFVRFVIAGTCMWWITKHREGRLPALTMQGLLPVLLLGATGVFAYNVLFFTGLKTVEAGRAAVIIALNPGFIALGSALVFKERLSLVNSLGIVLSVCGAWVVITRGNLLHVLDQGVGAGELAILGCVGAWVSYSLLGKQYMKRFSPHAAVTWSCLSGALFLFVPALVEGLPEQVMALPWNGWLDLVYLGFFGTVLGFTWYYQGVKAIGPARAGVFINFVPIFAIVAGWAILSERVDVSLALGGVFVACGVYLTNRRKRHGKEGGKRKNSRKTA